MKVEGFKDLRRTPSGAIINVNTKAYEAARERKRRQQEKDQELDTLREEVSELRQLVRKLLDG